MVPLWEDDIGDVGTVSARLLVYRHEPDHFGFDMCLNISCCRFLMLISTLCCLVLMLCQLATLYSFEFIIELVNSK
jgi:hypothetical protein